MARLLILIALLALAWWLWQRFTRLKRQPGQPSAPQAQPMVRCAHCGTHVPQTEALAHDNRWYCSRAHLEQDNPPESR